MREVFLLITKIKAKEDSVLHKTLGYTEIPLKPLSIFMGPNGAGKSSIVQGLMSLFDERNHRGAKHYQECAASMELETTTNEHIFEIISARQDNGKYRGYFGDDLTMDLEALFSSEGQSTMNLFLSHLRNLDKYVANPEKEVIYIIDELDSGLSFDNILKIRNFLRIVTTRYSHIQVIITAHNYEFAKSFEDNVFWVPEGEYKNLSLYEDYSRHYSEYKPRPKPKDM